MALLGILCVCILISEWLARTTPLRHLGTALVVIILAAVLANLGVIPTSTGVNPTYSVLFHQVAWLAIFWLLLEVDLRRVLIGGRVLLPYFLFACLATALAAFGAALVFDLPRRLGPDGPSLAGMFTGTYTGGSVNFVALASQFGMDDGVLLGAANAVDAALTTVWMAVTLLVPRFLMPKVTARSVVPKEAARPTTGAPTPATSGHSAQRSTAGETRRTVLAIEGNAKLTTTSLSALLALGLLAVWLSDNLPSWLEPLLGFELPGILILTTLALALAQVKAISLLPGSRLLGIFAVYLFLAVIGALCDVEAVRASGDLALLVSGFAVLLLIIHGLLLFGGTRLLGGDAEAASVASQAAVGGGATALVLARSLQREDLEVPSILMGALGNALGTYLGLLVAFLL